MFRHRVAPEHVVSPAEVDDGLRLEPDPDPLVEEATERLRAELGALHAVDQWGRPLAWRQVARIALGALATPRVRDAVTSERLAEEVAGRSVSPQHGPEPWREFFKAVDESDRLLGHEAGALPD